MLYRTRKTCYCHGFCLFWFSLRPATVNLFSMTTNKIVNHTRGEQVAFELHLFAYSINITIRKNRTKIRKFSLLLIESDSYCENITFPSLKSPSQKNKTQNKIIAILRTFISFTFNLGLEALNFAFTFASFDKPLKPL